LWDTLEQAGFDNRKWRRETVDQTQRQTRRATPSNFGEPRSNSRAAALAIWHRSRPALGTIVETYLRTPRCYTGPIPLSLRVATGRHPSDPKRWCPMMVAAVLQDGAIQAVHRTFLRYDGLGKADLDPDKMTLGPCKGGAVQLAPAGPILAIAEGIETSLSYMQFTATPTWSALSAGGIQNLVLPSCINQVVIVADPDPVGIIAAHSAARRWLREGRRVSICRPPLGCDFNDLARA
jgi:hypothetical protein